MRSLWCTYSWLWTLNMAQVSAAVCDLFAKPLFYDDHNTTPRFPVHFSHYWTWSGFNWLNLTVSQQKCRILNAAMTSEGSWFPIGHWRSLFGRSAYTMAPYNWMCKRICPVSHLFVHGWTLEVLTPFQQFRVGFLIEMPYEFADVALEFLSI